MGRPVAYPAEEDPGSADGTRRTGDERTAVTTPMPDHLLRVAEATKGFMPTDEGLVLYETALAHAHLGPVLEIGTYCGKSAVYLGAAARTAGTGFRPDRTISARGGGFGGHHGRQHRHDPGERLYHFGVGLPAQAERAKSPDSRL